MDDVTRDPRDEAMPYGVDTIRLRISFPAPPVSQGYNGRMWRMRPLRGWTGGQAANVPRPDGTAVAPLILPSAGSDTMEARRGQTFGDVAQDVRFALGAQRGQGEASGEDAIRRPEPSSRNDAGSFQERYQTAVDQALAALAAVNALPIGQRFAANSPKNTATGLKAKDHVLDVQFTTNYKYACRILGIDSATAREAIHAAKRREKLGAKDDCTFDLETGDIILQNEIIGNLFGD